MTDQGRPEIESREPTAEELLRASGGLTCYTPKADDEHLPKAESQADLDALQEAVALRLNLGDERVRRRTHGQA